MEENVFETTTETYPDYFFVGKRDFSIKLAATLPNSGFLVKSLDPDSLLLPPLTPPSNPKDSMYTLKIEKWKLELRKYCHKTTIEKKTINSAYAKLIGQCLPTMRDRLAIYPSFNEVKTSLDAIKLAKIIQVVLHSVSGTGNSMIPNFGSENNLICFRQKGQMINAKYLERF